MTREQMMDLKIGEKVKITGTGFDHDFKMGDILTRIEGGPGDDFISVLFESTYGLKMFVTCHDIEQIKI